MNYEMDLVFIVQGGSNMTGTDLCVNKPQQKHHVHLNNI